MGEGIKIPIIGWLKDFKMDDDAKQKLSGLISQHLGIDFGSMDQAGMLGGGSQIAGKAGDAILKVMQTSLGIIEDIYKKLVEASPLLQAVESLFNLAMQLFFMPLGNKLAEEMIPAILKMIDAIMDFWDQMKEKKLEDILTETLDKFVTIFVGYLRNIGTKLETHGGLLGSIGKLLNMIANLVEKFLPTLIGWSVGILQFLMENFPQLIGLIVGFKVAMIGLMIAQIVTSAMGPLGKLGIGLAVGIPVAAGAAAGIGTGAFIGGMGGGVSNHTSNSSYNTVNTPNVRAGGDNYTVNVYGYTDSELGGIIEDKVNDMSNRSRLRSGF